MRRYTFGLVALLLGLAPWHQAMRADAPRYTIENLGTFSGVVPTITGINASGQMSGFIDIPAGSRAVRYSGGNWSLVPGLDTMNSYAYGINAAGDLTGYRDTPAGQRAFRYRDGVGVEDIEPLAGGTFTNGFAINNAGVVVGYGDATGGILPAFSAAPGGPTTALPGLGGLLTIACGINDAGQVAGSALNDAFVQHAIRIEPGASAATDIGSFVGPGGSSAACAIDAAGRVGGQADSASGPHAFRFGPPLVDLDTFGSPGSNTESIADGTSVGFYTAGTAKRAFVHTDADGTIDLNTLVDNGAGWVLTTAKAINTNGTIVGEGTFNGVRSVFRLTKVASEPPDTTPPVISSVTANPAIIDVPNGNMVTVTVSTVAVDAVDPNPVCGLSSITSTGSTPSDYQLLSEVTASLKAVGGQSYTLTVTCTDASGNSSSGATVVFVTPDTTAPVISLVTATPSVIWPPNGKMVPVSVSVSATDNVDANPVCSLKSISGAAAEDFEITGQFTALVRAEKNKDGSSRVYSLKVKCSDAAGNRAFASVGVTVTNKDPQAINGISRKNK